MLAVEQLNSYSRHASPTNVRKYLTFRKTIQNDTKKTASYKFKIIQFADIHYGEASDTLWGPEQDAKSAKVLADVLNAEGGSDDDDDIDLVVLSGDQLTANDMNWNATTYYRNLIQVLLDAKPDLRWCMIFGNHDDAPMETKLEKNGTTTIVYTPAKTSRDQLLKVDMSYPGSFTQAGLDDVFGRSNYILPVYYLTDDNVPMVALQLYMLDSGGGNLTQRIDETQIEWLMDNNDRLYQKDGKRMIPGVAFQHIPSRMSDFEFRGDTCSGFHQGMFVYALACALQYCSFFIHSFIN